MALLTINITDDKEGTKGNLPTPPNNVYVLCS